jgi:hypothetical protein
MVHIQASDPDEQVTLPRASGTRLKYRRAEDWMGRMSLRNRLGPDRNSASRAPPPTTFYATSTAVRLPPDFPVPHNRK